MIRFKVFGVQAFWTKLLPQAVQVHETAKACKDLMDGPRRRKRVCYVEKGVKLASDDEEFTVRTSGLWLNAL